MTSQYDEEIDNLLSSTSTQTPLQRGGSSFDFSSFEGPSSAQQQASQFDSSTGKIDMGKYLTTVADALIRDDNRKYRIVLARDLVKSKNPEDLCREEIQRNKNKFCIRSMEGNGISCGVSHRNGNKEKVTLKDSSILVTIPGKEMAFVQPIGSAENVSPEDLIEWLKQENTLADWSHLFFLANMVNSNTSDKPQKIKPIKEFSIKAAIHKTPAKNAKFEPGSSSYAPSVTETTKKKLIEAHKLEKGKFSYKTVEFMAKMESQLVFLDDKLNSLSNAVQNINSDMLYEIKILEMEKNKIRLELGSRKSVVINEDYDDSSVWGTIALLTENISKSPADLSKGDFASYRTFETWARSKINNIDTIIKVMSGELQNLGRLQAMNLELVDLRNENTRLNNRLDRLEAGLVTTIGSIEAHTAGLPERIRALENISLINPISFTTQSV